MLGTRRFTRYLLRELATPTLLGLLLYTFVLLMNHFFLVAEKALAKNLGPELTMRLFLVGIPKLLVLSIPMAVLLGTLIGLGRLSADREWVALQAAGHGPGRIIGPVLLHGMMGAIVCFVIYSVVVPQTHYAVRNLRGEILFSSNLASDLRPRVLEELPDETVLYIGDIVPAGERRLRNVLAIGPDPEREEMTRLVLARRGDLYPSPDGTGALLADFFEGEAHSYRTDRPEAYGFGLFDFLRDRHEPPRFLRNLMTPPDKVNQDLFMPELLEEIRVSERERQELLERSQDPGKGRLMVADRRVASAKVELHRRIALPFAAICFAFLAVPLGIRSARSGKGAGFALSIVVIVIYRVVFVTATNQAINGRIPAEIGPWIANALIIAWALLALWLMRSRPLRTGGGLLGASLALGRRVRRRRRKAASAAEIAAGQDEAEPTSDLIALAGSGRRFIGRLDRYLALSYVRILLLTLFSTYLIYAVVEAQDLVDRALRTGQPLSLVVDYLSYFAPGVLHIVLPISCLIGAVVSIALLARTSELVAVTAAGVSLRRATAPVILLTLLLGAVLFFVQDRIAPSANREAQAVKDRIHRRAPRTHGLPSGGSWRFGSDGSELYHFRFHDPSSAEYRELTVFTIDRSVPRITGHRFSRSARHVEGSTWQLGDGWYRSFHPVGSDPEDIGSSLTLHEEAYEIELDLPRDLVDERRWLGRQGDSLPEQMSIAELREEIESLSDSGYDITKLQVAYYRKFAQALAPLVMVLLGLPFAFRVGRRGSLYGIGVALLLVLVYWATFAVFNALGLETLLPPAVAAWAPNALYGLLGIYLLLYVRT